MRVVVDCPDNVRSDVSGLSTVRMWLEVGVGLGPKLTGFSVTVGTTRLLVHMHRCCMLESAVRCALESFGLAAEFDRY